MFKCILTINLRQTKLFLPLGHYMLYTMEKYKIAAYPPVFSNSISELRSLPSSQLLCVRILYKKN